MNAEKSKVMRISRQSFPVQILLDQKQLENLEYLNYLCSVITKDARCTRELRSSIALAKPSFNKKKKNPFISELELNLRKKLVKCYVHSHLFTSTKPDCEKLLYRF
jgi:hypothetical protein